MFTAAINGMHLFLWKQSLLRLLFFLYSSIENYITCVRRNNNLCVCVRVCVQARARVCVRVFDARVRN